MKSTKNVSAAVRQRLLNYSKTANRSFSEVMQYYAMERFLYRLSISPHSNRFILKGGLLLRVWKSPEIRPTMDIDLLGITTNRESLLITQIHDILSICVKDVEIHKKFLKNGCEIWTHGGQKKTPDIHRFSTGSFIDRNTLNQYL